MPIKHSVIFSFKTGTDNVSRDSFFKAANRLSGINGVKNFEIARQVSTKNPYQFSIAMSFDTRALYDAYNAHSEHTNFINEYWIPYIDQFLEIDLEG